MHLFEVTLFQRLQCLVWIKVYCYLPLQHQRKTLVTMRIWVSEKCVCLRKFNTQPTAACYCLPYWTVS